MNGGPKVQRRATINFVLREPMGGVQVAKVQTRTGIPAATCGPVAPGGAPRLATGVPRYLGKGSRGVIRGD